MFRAPARINLRGMHIDTHGGPLNLITHQRETMLAASALEQPVVELHNADSRHAPLRFSFEDARKSASGWEAYVRGAVRALTDRDETIRRGLCGIMSSTIPEGAGLSSSSALCLTVIDALAAVNDIALDAVTRIELVRAAEWRAGARTGTSDAGAMVLAGRGIMASGPLPPGRIDLGAVRNVAWPTGLGVVVADSLERRELGRAEAVTYSKNRFAYFAGFYYLRARFGANATLDEVSRAIDSGTVRLRDVLNDVPYSIPINQDSDRVLAAEHDIMFGGNPTISQPMQFQLHGPVVFGLAESARARHFSTAIESGDYAMAGEIMNVGQAGDRESAWTVADSAGACESNENGFPLWRLAGAYGASTTALNLLADAALARGALGASLTGAGMGGCVVALCRVDEVERVVTHLRQTLQSIEYAAALGRGEPVSPDVAEEAVVVNETVPSAGEVDDE